MVAHGARCGLVGVGIAFLWTTVGYAVAFADSEQDQFISEWVRMQAFFCLALGVWLLLIAKSGTLTRRSRRITKKGSAAPSGIRDQRLRVLVILVVGCTGTASFIGMGFNASGSVLAFMWLV